MKPPLTARDRLIVALDFDSVAQARELVAQIGDAVSFYKIGLVLFMSAGPGFVQEMLAQGKRIFLDLKMADIDQTVRRAVQNIPAGVELTTIYGGNATIKAACQGKGDTGLAVLGVTWLSSMGAGERRDNSSEKDLCQYIETYADEALAAGADGLVASGSYVAALRARYKDRATAPIIVVPGIRPEGAAADEHQRTLSPKAAIKAGADFLVVGRPIRQAPDPRLAAQQIIEEISLS